LSAASQPCTSGATLTQRHLAHLTTTINMSTRWTDTPEDLAEAARLKAEKAAKRAAKEALRAAKRAQQPSPVNNDNNKRRRVASKTPEPSSPQPLKLLRFPGVELQSCRNVDDSYERLNHIEEGSYGIVSRAKDLETKEIVALKRLKLERETDGFPITSLREITTLMAARHPNVVNIREVVMGDTLKE
jgi:cell division cycle 2-like protein